MNDKEIRRAYQAIAKQETPSPELVSETLLKMHKELENLEEEEKSACVSPLEKISSFFSKMKQQTRWMMAAGLACAAMLCLFALRPDTALQIASITYQEDQRLSYAYRSETVDPLLPEWEDKLDHAMQSTDNLKRMEYRFVDFAFDESTPVLWAAIGRYDAAIQLEVTVSNFRPMLLDTLSGAVPNTIEGRAVYMGNDTAFGDCFAVWEEENALYIQVRMIDGADRNDQEKKRVITEVLRLPFATI